MAIKFLNTVAVDTDVLYVDASSNRVGIGTTSPATKLHINDGTNVNLKVGAVGGELQIKTTNDADSAYTSMVLRASEYNILNGNVGIGATSPGTKLTVSENATGLVSSITNSNVGGSGVQITAGNGTNNSLQIRNYAGGELMRVQGNGNVGIGTTSPTAAKLVVDSSVAPQLLVKNSSGGNAQILFEDNSGGTQNASITFDQGSQNTLTIATGYQSPTDLNRINIAPAGNIGLTVRGGTGGSGLGQPLVGIGTTSPSEKLEVNGNIKVSNAYPRIYLADTQGVPRTFSIGTSNEDLIINPGS
jgi:hypothetical protein